MINVELFCVTAMPLGKAMPSATWRAAPIGRDQCESHSAGRRYVDVAAAVDDDLVPSSVGEATQVRMGHQRAVGLATQNETRSARDHEQSAVAQPVDAEGEAERPIRTTTSLLPFGSTAMISCAPQSENHRRP